MIEYIARNIEEYLEYIEKYKGVAYFSGQANVEWLVEPSIFRDDDSLTNESSMRRQKTD